MLMYFFMFLAIIVLRIKAPNQPRLFRIPGGTVGLVVVVGLGLVGVMLTLFVSFMPPEGIDVGGVGRYEITLIIGLVSMCLPPFVSTWLQRKSVEGVCRPCFLGGG